MLKQYTIFIIVIASLLVFGSACGPDNESLTVTKLVGEKQNDTTNIVDIVAKNCVSPENKEYTCTAGTSSNFSVSLGSEQSLTIGINAIAGGQISLGISEQVAEDLGFNRSSGQALSFDSPERGYFTTYGVEERYTVTTGHVQIKSSTGTDREGSYIYRASCELTIIEQETLPCSGNSTTRTPTPTPKSNEPTWTPTRTPRPAPTWTPTETPRLPTPTPRPLSTTSMPMPSDTTSPSFTLVCSKVNDGHAFDGGLLIGCEGFIYYAFYNDHHIEKAVVSEAQAKSNQKTYCGEDSKSPYLEWGLNLAFCKVKEQYGKSLGNAQPYVDNLNITFGDGIVNFNGEFGLQKLIVTGDRWDFAQ